MNVYKYSLKRTKQPKVSEAIEKYKALNTPSIVVEFYKALKIEETEQEHLAVIILDAKNHVKSYYVPFIGGIESCPTPISTMIRLAVIDGASSIIVAHNHPSGDANPSNSDISLTKTLKDAVKILGIRLLDHVIVAGDKHYSFNEQGIL